MNEHSSGATPLRCLECGAEADTKLLIYNYDGRPVHWWCGDACEADWLRWRVFPDWERLVTGENEDDDE